MLRKLPTAVILVLFCLSQLAAQPVIAANPSQTTTSWIVLAPGVDYQAFLLPGPVRAYVSRMQIVDESPEDGSPTLESAIGRGQLGGLETVRGMAARYDDAINYWGQSWGNRSDILVAVNGSYFGNSDTPENGMVQSGWYSKRYTDLSGGSGLVWKLNRQVFIDDCIYHRADRQILRILDTAGQFLGQEEITGINTERDDNDLILFTPQFGPRTPEQNDGVEILVQLKRPLIILPYSANNPTIAVEGTIREIRQGVGSTLLPFDAVVVSAGKNPSAGLLANAQPGNTIRFNQEITSLRRDCGPTNQPFDWTKAYASVGAAIHLLDNGTAYPPNPDSTRAPRTAIAYNTEYIFLIVVDGRQPDFSIGMTFQELAAFIQNVLEAPNAVAQDGGGSSTMIVNGAVVNRPSDMCYTLFIPMINKPPGSSNNTSPQLPLEERFEPPDRLQYGCERRVANAIMIANSVPRDVSGLFVGVGDVFTTGSTQLRLGPGTNYPAYEIISAGSLGEIIADANGFSGIRAKGTYWWKVDFNGSVGWMDERDIAALMPRYTTINPY